MVQSEPTSENWHIRQTRDVEKWQFEFTEHWTCGLENGEMYYKLRVVGPNGEVAKQRMPKEDAPRDVRSAFERTFRDAADEA